MAPGGGWLRSKTGAVMPAARNSSPSSTRATANQVAPPSEGGPGHLDRAVPVGAGFDDGTQASRCGDLGEHASVVADGAQVDLGPGPPLLPQGTGRVGGIDADPQLPGQETARRWPPAGRVSSLPATVRESQVATDPASRRPPDPPPAERGGPAVAVRRQRGGCRGGQSPGQKGPNGTREDVARSGRRQSGRPGVDQQHLAPGVGDHRGRPFQQHDGPGCWAATLPHIRDPVVAGGRPTSRAYSPSCGVSTSGRSRDLATTGHRVEVAQGPQAVGVHHRRDRPTGQGGGPPSDAGRPRPSPSRPRPGPTTRALTRSSPGRHLICPALGRQATGHVLSRRQTAAGRRTGDPDQGVAGAGAHGATGHQPRGPVHVRRAGHDLHRALPLVRLARPGRPACGPRRSRSPARPSRPRRPVSRGRCRRPQPLRPDRARRRATTRVCRRRRLRFDRPDRGGCGRRRPVAGEGATGRR